MAKALSMMIGILALMPALASLGAGVALPPWIEPPLTLPANSPGGFSFTVNNLAGFPYVVEASSNLTGWVELGTNTVPFTFTDTNATKLPRCFYRTVYFPP